MSLRVGWEREPSGGAARRSAVNLSEGPEPAMWGKNRGVRAGTGHTEHTAVRGPTVLQVVEGEVPEVRGEVGQCQQPPGQCVPEEMGARTVWEQPIPDDLRGDISTPRWPWYPGELYGAGLTSSVVCTILSTEEKYASHRNWVCCWNASTRSGRMQRTAEGICRIGGMGFSSQTLPPPLPPGQPLVLGMGQHCSTCRSSRSLPTTAALPQSMASEKGSSQPSLSSTGMQAACTGPHEHGDTGDGPSCPHSPLVPAVPPGSGRSPGAGHGARCRRWSYAAAPGSQTWWGKGSQAWAQHHPLPSNEAQCTASTQIPEPQTALSVGTTLGGLRAVHPPGYESPFCAAAGRGIHRALRPHRKIQY